MPVIAWLILGAWLGWLVVVGWANYPVSIGVGHAAPPSRRRLSWAVVLAGVSVVSHGALLALPFLTWDGTPNGTGEDSRDFRGWTVGIYSFVLLWPLAFHIKLIVKALRARRATAASPAGPARNPLRDNDLTAAANLALALAIVAGAIGLGVLQASRFDAPGLADRDAIELDEARAFEEHSLAWFGTSYEGVPFDHIDRVDSGTGGFEILYQTPDKARRVFLTVKPGCKAVPPEGARALRGGALFHARAQRLRLWSGDVMVSVTTRGLPLPGGADLMRDLMPLNESAAQRLAGWPGPNLCE